MLNCYGLILQDVGKEMQRCGSHGSVWALVFLEVGSTLVGTRGFGFQVLRTRFSYNRAKSQVEEAVSQPQSDLICYYNT
jgi:hypothetical protein